MKTVVTKTWQGSGCNFAEKKCTLCNSHAHLRLSSRILCYRSPQSSTPSYSAAQVGQEHPCQLVTRCGDGDCAPPLVAAFLTCRVVLLLIIQSLCPLLRVELINFHSALSRHLEPLISTHFIKAWLRTISMSRFRLLVSRLNKCNSFNFSS